MMQLAKHRSRAKGLPFDITEDDIEVPVFCPILGVKLERGMDGKGNNDHAPSLDRIEPEKGYVRGNVIVVSMKANRMKSNGSPAELRKIADFYTRLTKENSCLTTTKSGPKGSSRNTASPSPTRRKTTAPMSNVLLLDGDIFAYWASFGAEREIMLEEDLLTYDVDLEAAREKVVAEVEAVVEDLGAKRFLIALSDNDANFRKELSGSYKLPRTTQRKPLALRHIRKYLAEKFDSKMKERLEADDVLGILMTHPKLVEGKKIIVSSDKDLLQIPGRHYNPRTGKKQMVSEAQADRSFYMQVLTGDVTDNYPGCPGIGAKRAPAILDAEGEVWGNIVKAYEKAGLEDEDALLQARLARILRTIDYDFKKKEPILWTP